MVFCPQKKAIATGDLLHGSLPISPMATPKEWPRTLNTLTEFPFDHATGGHGGVQGREIVGQMAGYTRELTEAVDAGKRRGQTVQDLQAALTPARLKPLGGGYGEFLQGQMKRSSIDAAITPPAQALADGIKTNIADILDVGPRLTGISILDARFLFSIPLTAIFDPASCTLSAGGAFPPRRHVRPAEKSETGNPILRCIPRAPLRSLPPGRLISLRCIAASTPSAPPAHRSAAPCSRTAAASDGFPPAAASSTGRA